MQLNRRQFNFSLAMIPFLGKLVVPKETHAYYVASTWNAPKDGLLLLNLSHEVMDEMDKLNHQKDIINKNLKDVYASDTWKIDAQICALMYADLKEIFYLDVPKDHNFKTCDRLPLSTSNVYLRVTAAGVDAGREYATHSDGYRKCYVS